MIVENPADAGVSAPRDCEHIFALTRDCLKLTVLEQNQNASHTYLGVSRRDALSSSCHMVPAPLAERNPRAAILT